MTDSMNYQDSTTEKELFREASDNADDLGANDLSIINPLELIYKFIFDPKADFMEINKLWSLTYLKPEDKKEILMLAKNIRVYDQPKYYSTVQQRELIGFENEEFEINGEIVTQIKPKYKVTLVYKSRFHEMIEKDLGRIQSICASAGGLNGSLVRAFRTTSVEKHESVEDKTAPKNRWLNMGRRD